MRKAITAAPGQPASKARSRTRNRLGRPAHVGLLEVAAAASVSASTVSNVLNRPELVAVKTRLRVEEAIMNLGFVPNSAARSLRTGRTTTIGVIVLDVANPFWGEVTRGIEDVAGQTDHGVLLCSSNESLAKERRALRMLQEYRAAGLLIAPIEKDIKELERLHVSGSPVVLLDRATTSAAVSSVAVDDIRGGWLAVKHLLDLGHRRITLVNGPEDISWCADRSAGAHMAISQAGLDPASTLTQVTMPALTAACGHSAAARILEQNPRPTAIFCANDLMAVGVLKELTTHGVLVPADMSLVGYDDVEFAAALSPSLTSVHQDPYQLGRAAAELLLNHADQHHETQHVVFQPRLIIRASTGVRAANASDDPQA